MPKRQDTDTYVRIAEEVLRDDVVAEIKHESQHMPGQFTDIETNVWPELWSDMVYLHGTDFFIETLNKTRIREMWIKNESNQYATKGLMDWLITAQVKWRMRAFESKEDYVAWVEHLASCYGDVRGSGKGKNGTVMPEKYRNNILPNGEYLALLHDCPWLVFLITLGIRWKKIAFDIARMPELPAPKE